MEFFNQLQKQQIHNTSLKLREIVTHPAYPFLNKTFMEIIVKYDSLNDLITPPSELKAEVFQLHICYTNNLLIAFNLRIDSILRERVS